MAWENAAEKYLGREYVLRSGVTVRVVRYDGYHDTYVETQDEHKAIVKCEIAQLKRGTLHTPFEKLVAGVGYLGVGPYTPRPAGKEKSPSYVRWGNMLTRVYRYGIPAYRGVKVCDEWLNFQTFSSWFYEQYGWDMDWHLDKDLFGGAEKIYCPENCVLVPRGLNSFAVGIYKENECLPGVHMNLQGKYIAQMSNVLTGKRESLGRYDNDVDGFKAYKRRKEDHLKEIIQEYKGVLPQSLKDRLEAFQVIPLRMGRIVDMGENIEVI